MFAKNSVLKKIFLMGFLFALHQAFTAYINSSFLSQFSGERYVGLIFMAGSLCSLISLFLVPGALGRTGEYTFLLWSSGLCALALLLLSISTSLFLIIPVFICYFVLNGLIIFALDELLEIFSKSSLTGSVRGLYLTVLNLAWVMAQLASGRTLSDFSFSSVYLVGFAIMALFFLISCFALRHIKDPKYDNILALASYKKFFQTKNLARSYKMNFLLQFFYAWMVIYTPLYLYAHIGFDWKEIGAIFTVMLIPFVLIQYPLGRYSDMVGERRMLMLGFFIASIATASLFFIRGKEIWIWAIALFMTRVGAATIEVMSDAYFFKHITRENDEFVSIYRNTGALSYLLGPLIAFIVFNLTPSFNFIYAVLSAVLLYGAYLASTIRKSDI